MQVFEYNQRKHEVKNVPFADINFHHRKWINLTSPSDETLKKVGRTLHIPLRDLRSAIDEEERSKVVELEHYTLITCRYPKSKGNHAITYSMGFFVSDNLLLTISRYENEALTPHLEADMTELFKQGMHSLFVKLFQSINNQFFARMDALDESIDELEKEVFQTPSEDSVKKIYKIKKTLIYFHRAFSANREVLLALEKVQKIPKNFGAEVRTLYDDTVQLLDMATLYREIMTSTLDIYLGSVSNKLNIIMKRLSAYAALIMVPTFITGLYGMNFRFMPEIAWPYGYAFAWAMIIISVVVMTVYFKKQDWI